MALSFAHGAIQWAAADVATTVYTVSGLSFQPKALRFYWMGMGSDTDTSSQNSNSVRRGVGFAASTTDRRCVASSSTMAGTDSQCGTTCRDDAVVASILATTLEGLLDLNSITSDGFTLIVDDQGVVNLSVFWEAWGGEDISVVTTQEITEPGATGNVAYTVTGFTADATDQVVMFAGNHSTATNTTAADDGALCVGFASGTTVGENITIVGSTDEASATPDTDGYALSGECLAMVVNGGAGSAINARATLNAWQANAFQLNWIARAASRKFIAMAIKGGAWKAADLTLNTNTAAATSTVSGLTFTPLGMCLMGMIRTESTAGTGSANDWMSMGTGSSTTSRRAMGMYDENAPASGNPEINHIIQYDQVLSFISSGGSAIAQTDIATMAPNGFTLIVDTAGGVANDWIGYLTFGSAIMPTASAPMFSRRAAQVRLRQY